MADTDITYAMVRAVREETGASHEDCRRVLEEANGNVEEATKLWYRQRNPKQARADA